MMLLKLLNSGKILFLLVFFLFLISLKAEQMSFYHPIWSGYEISSSNLIGVSASWIVPAQSGSGTSAQWIGIGGDLGHNLIQIGTSYLNSQYSAWYECTQEYQCSFIPYPESGIALSQTVRANDIIKAEIKLMSNSTVHPGIWLMSINDTTQHWVNETNVSYNPNNQSFEVIDELLKASCLFGYECASLSKFAYSAFGPDFTNSRVLSAKQSNSDFKSFEEFYKNSSVSSYAYTLQSNISIQIPGSDGFSVPGATLANPDPITPDGSSFWVTYGDLRVANISNLTPKILGKNATFEAIVPGNSNHKLLYQWAYVNRDFSLSQVLTPLRSNNSEFKTMITGPKILAVFVTDNSSTDPKPQAYNWTLVGDFNLKSGGQKDEIEPSPVTMERIDPYSVPITLTNTQQYATPIGFQQVLDINSRRFPMINSNWTNVDFTDAAGEPLQAWVESNCTSSSTHVMFWLNVSPGIGADGSLPLNVTFASGDDYDGVWLGEAPQLSSTYGQHDNGPTVFPVLYQNFAGTDAPSGWTAYSGSVAVNDGLSIAFTSGTNNRFWTDADYGLNGSQVLDFYGNITGSGVGFTNTEFGYVETGGPAAGWGISGSTLEDMTGGTQGNVNPSGLNHIFSTYWPSSSSSSFDYDYGTMETLTTGLPSSQYPVGGITWSSNGGNYEHPLGKDKGHILHTGLCLLSLSVDDVEFIR